MRMCVWVPDAAMHYYDSLAKFICIQNDMVKKRPSLRVNMV